MLVQAGGYMDGAEGMVIDTSGSMQGSFCADETTYTVEVEEHGLHFFYGADLSTLSETETRDDQPDWWMS